MSVVKLQFWIYVKSPYTKSLHWFGLLNSVCCEIEPGTLSLTHTYRCSVTKLWFFLEEGYWLTVLGQECLGISPLSHILSLEVSFDQQEWSSTGSPWKGLLFNSSQPSLSHTCKAKKEQLGSLAFTGLKILIICRQETFCWVSHLIPNYLKQCFL